MLFPGIKITKIGGRFLPIRIFGSLLCRCFKVMKKGNSLPTLICLDCPNDAGFWAPSKPRTAAEFGEFGEDVEILRNIWRILNQFVR